MAHRPRAPCARARGSEGTSASASRVGRGFASHAKARHGVGGRGRLSEGCRLAVVGGASRGVGGEGVRMRSCERCFCAAGFAQTWPPWSMRVSEKSSSNEKKAMRHRGRGAREHERARAQVEVGAPTEEDDHHRGIVVKVVGVEEGDAWGGGVCVGVCGGEEGDGGRGVRRRLRGFAGGEGGPILPRSISPKIV